MKQSSRLRVLIILFLLAVSLYLPTRGMGYSAPQSANPAADVTAFDLIIAMNTLRMSYGLPALIEDPIINAVAQSTAEIMAAQQMSWHIGDVRGRLAAAGYGGGVTVWATENFAVGNMSIDEIMLVWSDESHMLPAVIAAYCHVGAGVAKAPNGMTYYILQAAYTSTHACGEYKSATGKTPAVSASTRVSSISQRIVPVKIATPDAEGKIIHVVEQGQSFWSIAVAYKITVKDLEYWNNLSKEDALIIGQRLFIPGKDTKGYATPTPVGMVITSTPGADDKIIHTVQSYQTLSSIAQAYQVKIDRILSLNGLKLEWPLQIGQKLVIYPGSVTPSATPRPLTPIEKLTPEGDGRYYHVVKSGETLTWIANLYTIKLNDLMIWNGLNETSILRPGQKLVLQVTPPVRATPTVPATAVLPAANPPAANLPLATRLQVAATASAQPATLIVSATAAESPVSGTQSAESTTWLIIIGAAVLGLFLVVFFSLKRP
jgi:LysM repeat protein